MIKLILKAGIGFIFLLCFLISVYILIKTNKKRAWLFIPTFSLVLFVTSVFDFLEEIGIYVEFSDVVSEYGIILFFILWIFKTYQIFTSRTNFRWLCSFMNITTFRTLPFYWFISLI